VKYKLSGAVSGEIPVLGHRYPFDFAANRTTPQSEQDEAVFEHLVEVGYATRVPETASDKERIEAEETPAPVEPEAPETTEEEA
jgi:hypothetical protein